MPVNHEDLYFTDNLSEQEREAVEWLEAASWVVQTGAAANLRDGIPAVYSAEKRGSFPARRQQAHSLVKLRAAVEGDLRRHGETVPVVAIDTDAVHHSVTTTPTGDSR